ncbi:hypothetical protein APHAL10511_008514 [Amanita phalloides]|nr:hypothetical protein APHAL10511_008514 [Amanita phalloides]
MVSVQLLFGPMLIGTFLNMILYGVMVVQAGIDVTLITVSPVSFEPSQLIVYLQTYKHDARWLRYFMYFLFVSETINSGFTIAVMYEPLILRYGKPEAVEYFPLSLSADPVMTVIISTPVQIFIAWRIKVITKSRLLAVVIGFLALVALSGGIWLTVTVTRIRRFSLKPKLHWPALTWLLSSALADVIIAAILTWSLFRRKTSCRDTDHAINKIMRITIQTGLITAIFATLDVVCFLGFPHTSINFVWDFSLSKLYSNALLSTLNARRGLEITNSTMMTTFGNDNILFGSIGSEGIVMDQVTIRRREPLQVDSTSRIDA